MKHKQVLFLTQAAVIAAVYVVLTMVFAPISFGQSGIDIRIAEALTILPVFTPAAVPGLFVGCLLANILGGSILWDVLFGSLATLIGAAGCRMLRHHRWLAPLVTVAANTVVVPLVLIYGYGLAMPLPLLMASVGAGEVLSAYVLGEVLYAALRPISAHLFGAAQAG